MLRKKRINSEYVDCLGSAMANSLRELYGSAPGLSAMTPMTSMASMASATPQRILDLSRYAVRPYDMGAQFLSQPTAAVSKILGQSIISFMNSLVNSLIHYSVIMN